MNVSRQSILYGVYHSFWTLTCAVTGTTQKLLIDFCELLGEREAGTAWHKEDFWQLIQKLMLHIAVTIDTFY